MFFVTGCAIGRCDFGKMVEGAVVAIEAGSVRGFCEKDASLLNVTGGTFFFKNGVGLRQTTGAIDPGIARHALFRDPKESQQRQKEAEPEFGALQ